MEFESTEKQAMVYETLKNIKTAINLSPTVSPSSITIVLIATEQVN